MSFRQDRYNRGLYSTGRHLEQYAPGLYEVPEVEESEPGLYKFDAVAHAIGYVSITTYNSETI